MTSQQNRTALPQDQAAPPSNSWVATPSPPVSEPAKPRELTAVPYVEPPKWEKPTAESNASINPGLPMYHYHLPSFADLSVTGSIGTTVTKNPDEASPPPPQPDIDVTALQEKLKAYGVFNGAATGQLDKPTRKAMQTLAALMGDGTSGHASNIGDARQSVDILQGHADQMLYAVDRFPFAGKAPNWLLSLLEDSDVASIAAQVESALNNDITQTLSIDAGRSNVGIIAITRPDPVQGSLLHCRAYHLTFAKGPMHFAVTARACRNPVGTDWRVAPN